MQPALAVPAMVPATGRLSLPLTLPAAWPFDQAFPGQWLLLEQQPQRLVASNTVVLLVRS